MDINDLRTTTYRGKRKEKSRKLSSSKKKKKVKCMKGRLKQIIVNILVTFKINGF